MENTAHVPLAEPCQHRGVTSRYPLHPGRAPSRKARRRGVSSVEFAIVAPLLFLILFGVVEIGRLVMVRQSLTNAARVGCRKAALATTVNSADVEAAVRSYLQSVIKDASDPTKVTVSMSPSNPATITAGTPITVVVGTKFSDVSWGPGNFLGFDGGLTFSGRSTHRRE